MTKQTLETIKKALDMGFSIEQAYALATLEAGAKSAPKPAKKTAPAKQAAREANIEASKSLDALALITGAKWTVEQGTHTLTGETIWTIKPVDRFDKAQFYAVSKRLSDDLDGGYFRGGWTVRIDPTEYLATGKVGDVAAKHIADLKAARKAAREAKKAAKKA